MYEIFWKIKFYYYFSSLSRIPNMWDTQVSVSFETGIAHAEMNYANKITIIIDESHWKMQDLN